MNTPQILLKCFHLDDDIIIEITNSTSEGEGVEEAEVVEIIDNNQVKIFLPSFRSEEI